MSILRRARLLGAVLAAVCLSGAMSAFGRQSEQPVEASVDAIFARWTTATPGCTVAVSRDDRKVLEKAYGMADLEHLAPNEPETIFEAGSVSKQFTAAAVLLLAREGKLSLDDPARKYIPELPNYGVPLTIRHMLTHTSGLRDWGSVAGIAGWPRTTRVYTHGHVLDIVSRQRSLNFRPGTNWSYSNTGYNLAAIIVSRVSGQPFADFTRQRIFEPLGMTRTSWRDDYSRIVKGRATAYAEGRNGFRTQMPFENVHGNGGLLTTVGDLLRWNANFSGPRVGDQGFLAEEQEPGRFSDGRPHQYALGLYTRPYKGVPEVSHGGATAGYRAFLARYPDRRLSVAVLCNVSSGATERYAHAVADLYLGSALVIRQVVPAQLQVPQIAPLAGLYRHSVTGQPLALAVEKEKLTIGGQPLVPTSPTRFELGDDGPSLEFDNPSRVRMVLPNGLVETYEKVIPSRPDAPALGALAGSYTSDEAEVTLNVAVDGEALTVRRGPETPFVVYPLYADAFDGPLGTVRFTRDNSGRITGLSISQDRVWDLRFKRQ